MLAVRGLRGMDAVRSLSQFPPSNLQRDLAGAELKSDGVFVASQSSPHGLFQQTLSIAATSSCMELVTSCPFTSRI